MSKAIQGLAMLGAAVADGVAMFALASTGVGVAALPFMAHLMEALVVGGIAMEGAAAADALLQNRGMAITSRQPAAFRQIVYGEQRVGGIIIYQSTTGSEHDQYNFVIVLAGHVIDSIVNVYLDGRQIYWQGSGAGWIVRNGIGVGGIADGSDHIGPDGQTYNFGGTGHSGLYFEPRFGDQSDGDVIGGLTANDPHWATTGAGSPWVGGCPYGYLKIEYNQSVFPNVPEIKFTIRGKNDIFDPRTGTRGYTTNWALIVADVITNADFGLGDDSVNQDQLIAAANVCDEQISLAAGGTEDRYAAHWHTDTGTAPGDMLQTLMSAAAGRLSRIGGEWYIWPAYWQGPSFSFDETVLAGPVQWTPTRSLRELWNRVNGTYIAPNFPYNSQVYPSDLYDTNGWYNGMIANTWPFAFQPTNYPQYAQDPLHGYAFDALLFEDSGAQAYDAGKTYNIDDAVFVSTLLYRSLIDGNVGNTPASSPTDWAVWQGNLLPKELGQPCCLSVAQAQRVAKIQLLRNRQQGSGTLAMQLEAWQMQPVDVFNQTFAALGWIGKQLEVTKVDWAVQKDRDGSPKVVVSFGVQETDISVYEWSTSEELTVYDVPSSPAQTPSTIPPPTGLALTSGVSTALRGADGTVIPSILASWTAPASSTLNGVDVQYEVNGSGNWLDYGLVRPDVTQVFIRNVVVGTSYDVRVQSVQGSATSTWDEADGCLVQAPSNSQSAYTINPQIVLSQTSPTTIALAACTCSFGGLPPVNYAARTFTIPAPTGAIWYYVTIADPNQAGETGVTLTATCQTSNALAGVQGNTYLGAIAALPGGSATRILAGGWPAPQTTQVGA